MLPNLFCDIKDKFSAARTEVMAAENVLFLFT